MTQVHQRGTPTPNKNRLLPQTYHQPNVGTLSIDWNQPSVPLTLRLLDVDGRTQIEQTIQLNDLK
jgi:hypothetical protein